MLMNLHAPRNTLGHTCLIARILAIPGQRIRRDQLILEFNLDNKKVSFASPYDGWIRFIAVKEGSSVESGDLLVIIDAIDVIDYRIDEQEVNLHTELGEQGRRGLERAGQRSFTNGYSGELFDAPAEQQGNQAQRSVKDHPFLKNMKEGVPPKMSDAHNNQPATERLAEDASNDPELRKQLDMKLQAQLHIAPGPKTSPTLTRG